MFHFPLVVIETPLIIYYQRELLASSSNGFPNNYNQYRLESFQQVIDYEQETAGQRSLHP